MVDWFKNRPLLFTILITLLLFVVIVVISITPRIYYERIALESDTPTQPIEITDTTPDDVGSKGEQPDEQEAVSTPTPTVSSLLEKFLATPDGTPRITDQALTPSPTIGPISTGPAEWNQDAANPQRTGYIQEEPELPWEFIWSWNGPDERGNAGNHFYDAPPEARTITGGGYVYVPAGAHGVFALFKTDGSPAWNFIEAPVNAAPAYDPNSGMLFIGGGDGTLYQVDSHTGEAVRSYPAESPINKAVLLAEGFVYVLTEIGELHKINKGDLSSEWVYRSGAGASTPPAFSSTARAVVFATDDLYLHAVDSEEGAARWRVNPSPNPARFPFTYEGYWPVISEQHKIVFFRLNLGMDGLWSGPKKGQKYPNTNAEIREYLLENPHLKNLFALDIKTGEEKFIPAVGYGGVEMLVGDDKPELITGPVPVIKKLPEGREVAYMFFRTGQSPHPDGRWDSHIGEMVLDDQTIPSLEAGDLRFVRFSNSYVHIGDEQCPLTMAGDTLFHAHWGASESTRITDRSPELGLIYEDPIRSEANPVIIRRMQACNDFNPGTHWTTCGLTLYDDGRFWNGPGWWVYWDSLDPPTPSRRAYSEGTLPRYTYVSGGLVIVQGNGGELMVFRHSGR
jgi:outer membrane protein assembly factor BamB